MKFDLPCELVSLVATPVRVARFGVEYTLYIDWFIVCEGYEDDAGFEQAWEGRADVVDFGLLV